MRTDSLTAAAHLVRRQRNLQPDRLRRFVQPRDVLFQPKDLAAVGAQAFEHAVAIQQAVVEHADLGVFLRNKLTVDVDLARHGSGQRTYHGDTEITEKKSTTGNCK